MLARFINFILISAFFSCKDAETILPPIPTEMETVDILALGDSYTIGQSVPQAGTFPFQLADSLRAAGFQTLDPLVIARTGWRTDDLQKAYNSQPQAVKDSVFSLVTLLIGVNNQFQNGDLEVYKVQFEQLLQTAIARAGNRPGRVVVLSIPDWAYTTYGKSLTNPSAVSQRIDQFNDANRTITDRYGVSYVDVTGISRRGLAEPDLIASDGLHPSAKQYTEWLRVLLPVVINLLK